MMAVTPEPVAAVNTICRISILHPLKKLQFLGQFRLGFVRVKTQATAFRRWGRLAAPRGSRPRSTRSGQALASSVPWLTSVQS